MKKTRVYLCLLLFIAPITLWSQGPDPDVPLTLESPYNTVRAHLYYLQSDSYQPNLAAQTLYNVRDSTKKQRLAIQLKQVLDGLGLFVRLKQIPQDSNYTDSTSQQAVYVLFPNDLPEVYV